MISAEGLTKYYGPIPAIQGVSFHVDQGEIVGFLGPNGAGKTTTMRILTGYMPATSGVAKIAGFDVSKDPIEVKRRVGYLPENVPLYPEMLVSAFLRFVAEVKGVERRNIPGEIDRVVERCGLIEVKQRLVKNLSKGFRQRLGLAQALIGSPPVLILDEPTVGLDPRQIIDIRNMIKGLAEEHTIMLSSHILPEVAMICQRVMIIHHGRLVVEDTMERLGGEGEVRLLELEAMGATARIRELLAGIDGVQDVSVNGEQDRYVIRTDAAKDPREMIIQALVQAGIPVAGLHERRRTLEDVFVEVVSQEESQVVADAGEEDSV